MYIREISSKLSVQWLMTICMWYGVMMLDAKLARS
ncbi:hypothetical protein BVRB_7g161510 [Beta vulgaris subsp. vulgaris]|nr:hypothetical protein BVRB_7g161510 [Beta vulgaris subsp. vulgaris]